MSILALLHTTLSHFYFIDLIAIEYVHDIIESKWKTSSVLQAHAFAVEILLKSIWKQDNSWAHIEAVSYEHLIHIITHVSLPSHFSQIACIWVYLGCQVYLDIIAIYLNKRQDFKNHSLSWHKTGFLNDFVNYMIHFSKMLHNRILGSLLLLTYPVFNYIFFLIDPFFTSSYLHR